MTIHSLGEIETTGMLWLFNSAVLHPRGYHLMLIRDEETGMADGWALLGDGGELVEYDDDLDEDDQFNRVKAFLALTAKGMNP